MAPIRISLHWSGDNISGNFKISDPLFNDQWSLENFKMKRLLEIFARLKDAMVQLIALTLRVLKRKPTLNRSKQLYQS